MLEDFSFTKAEQVSRAPQATPLDPDPDSAGSPLHSRKGAFSRGKWAAGAAEPTQTR